MITSEALRTHSGKDDSFARSSEHGEATVTLVVTRSAFLWEGSQWCRSWVEMGASAPPKVLICRKYGYRIFQKISWKLWTFIRCFKVKIPVKLFPFDSLLSHTAKL